MADNNDPLGEEETPTAEEVDRVHTNADTDTRAESLHHTLGARETQAAPGSHRHDGGDSVLLLEGVIVTGSKAGNLALQSVISALVRLGAEDSST